MFKEPGAESLRQKNRLNINKTSICINSIIRTQHNDKTLNVGECVTKAPAQDSQLHCKISSDYTSSSPEGAVVRLQILFRSYV